MDSRIQHTLCVSKAARLAAFFVFRFLVHSTYSNPMFDHQLRPIIDRPLNAVARRLARWGIGADQITWAGFGIGMAGAGVIAFELYSLGLILILASRIADGLDGAVARATGHVSDRGGFLDIVLDFLFYSAIPFAFAVAAPDQNALAAAFLIWSFIGTGASFLGYAVIAGKRGISTNAPNATNSIWAPANTWRASGSSKGCDMLRCPSAWCRRSCLPHRPGPA